MATNQYDYQKKCIGDAVSILMSLIMPIEERISGAMAEFRLAFKDTAPSGEALEYFLKVKEIMGDAPTRERIGELDERQRARLSVAFWELDRRVQRAYYEAEHGK